MSKIYKNLREGDVIFHTEANQHAIIVSIYSIDDDVLVTLRDFAGHCYWEFADNVQTDPRYTSSVVISLAKL